MNQLKSHLRHDDSEIMSISHIHVLLLCSAISSIVSLTLPSWFPVLVLKLPIIHVTDFKFLFLVFLKNAVNDFSRNHLTFYGRRHGGEALEH